MSLFCGKAGTGLPEYVSSSLYKFMQNEKELILRKLSFGVVTTPMNRLTFNMYCQINKL